MAKRKSGNPAKAGWEPMQQLPPNPMMPMVTMAWEGQCFYRYRNPDLKPVAVEAWGNRLYNGILLWFNDGSGHFSFKRQDRTPIRDWRHVQSIKNEIAGPDREAVEIYPPEDMLHDGANEYHLWILPPEKMLAAGFRDRAIGEPMHTFDRAKQRVGNPSPGGSQRAWEDGLSTGPTDEEREQWEK